MRQPDRAAPRAAPYRAPDGSPSTKPAIPGRATGTIRGARIVMGLGAVLQFALHKGWLTTSDHALLSDPGLLQLVADLLLDFSGWLIFATGLGIEWARRNGGAQPSPIKPLIGGR